MPGPFTDRFSAAFSGGGVSPPPPPGPPPPPPAPVTGSFGAQFGPQFAQIGAGVVAGGGGAGGVITTFAPPQYQDSPYVNLVTGEYQNSPDFLATIQATTQGYSDAQALLAAIPTMFDLDLAVGQQLDYTGQWIGQSRRLPFPITPLYFSFDTEGSGFDQAYWYDPFNPTINVTTVDDDLYRVLLRAKVAANYWDGTIPGAYAAYDYLLQGTGATVLITDHENKTMTVTLSGTQPPGAITAMFTNGLLALCPAGVSCTYVTAF